MVEYPDTLGGYVVAMNERFDAGLTFVPNAELRELLITERYTDAYHDPQALLVHPLNLVRGLAQAAAKLGARIYEDSHVCAVRRDGSCKLASTDRGWVRARHIVLAGGAYQGPLHRRLGAALVPVASFVMTTKPIPERIHTAIRTAAGISDSRLIPDYYRALPDGRLFWGGGATACPPSPERITRLLRDNMRRIYPQLADVKAEVAWSGLMSSARHRMPIIAPVADRLWIAAAFGGQGLATTMLAGDLIASAIADGDDRYQHFARFGLPFVGGPLIGLDGDEHGRSTISRAVHRARSCSRSQFPPVLRRPMSASDRPRIYTRLTDATRILRSIDQWRQSGVSHQSPGSEVSIGSTFGWHNR
jgi:gamma-glutamylputrescine oxidase